MMPQHFSSKFISSTQLQQFPFPVNESFISILFVVAPQVAVSPKALVASPGSNVSFQCNASGIPDPVITWTKEGMILPKKHLVANDILTLTSLVGLDEGRYLCTATNAAGVSQKTVTLTVEGLCFYFVQLVAQ